MVGYGPRVMALGWLVPMELRLLAWGGAATAYGLESVPKAGQSIDGAGRQVCVGSMGGHSSAMAEGAEGRWADGWGRISFLRTVCSPDVL